MENENKDKKLIIIFSILIVLMVLTVVTVGLCLVTREYSATIVQPFPLPTATIPPVPIAVDPMDPDTIYNNEYIVVWSADVDEATRIERIEALGDFEYVEDLGDNMSVVRCETRSPSEILELLRNIGGVESADPNYIIVLDSVSNDPYASSQWGLDNDGSITYVDFASGKEVTITSKFDVDINYSEAVTYYKENYESSREIIVAVIDTGADISHPDLSANIWINEGEIPGDGIDNDGNGYVDDVYGWDFYNGDSTVFHADKDYSGKFLDNDTHGTLVAGIIAAIANNNEGISGAASFINVKIMVLKANGGQGNGSGKVSDAIAAINYATAMGAKVCNISWGVSKSIQNLDSLKYAMETSDMLFVCAAGNAGTNNDEAPVYPANLGLPNSMSVTMCDQNGKLVVPSALANYGSNYGLKTVDIAAPGVSICSTVPEGKYNLATGSSFAAPYVSAIAAVILSTSDHLNPADVKKLILSTAKLDTALPTPSPEPTPEVTPDPEASPSPEVTPDAEVSPSPEPSSAPEASPSPTDDPGQAEDHDAVSMGIDDEAISPSASPAPTEDPGPAEDHDKPNTDGTETPDITEEPTPSPSPTPTPTPGTFAGLEGKISVPGVSDMYAALKAAGSLLTDTEEPEIEFTRTFDQDVIILTVTGTDGASGVRILRYELDESLDDYKELAHFCRGTAGSAYTEAIRVAKGGVYSFYVSDYAGNEKVVQYVLRDDISAPEISLLTTTTSPAGKLMAVLDVSDYESGLSSFLLLPGEKTAADFDLAKNEPQVLEPVDGRLLLRLGEDECYTLCACDYRGNISTYVIKTK